MARDPMKSKKKSKGRTDCRDCGKKGTYRYGKGLCELLKLQLWEGVYFCDPCMAKLEGKNENSIYDMLV